MQIRNVLALAALLTASPAAAQQIPGQDPITNQRSDTTVPPAPQVTVPEMPPAQPQPLDQVFEGRAPLERPADELQLFTPSPGSPQVFDGPTQRDRALAPELDAGGLPPTQTPPSPQSQWGQPLSPPSNEASGGVMGERPEPSSPPLGEPADSLQPPEQGTFLREPGGRFPSDF